MVARTGFDERKIKMQNQETESEEKPMEEDGGVAVGRNAASVTIESVSDRFLKLTEESVRDWVGTRTAERAQAYLPKVGTLSALADGYAARVQGTDLYTTNVFANADGSISSVCSCPVGMNCKHGAALALVVSETLKEKGGEAIFPASDDSLRLDRDAVLERVRESRGWEYLSRRTSRFDPHAPIPARAPDFARERAGGPILFPNKRFEIGRWPNLRCGTVEEVRDALSSFRLVGRVLAGVRLFGDSSSSEEGDILCEAGLDTMSDLDCLRARRAYARMPSAARIPRRVCTHQLARIAFRDGSSFEVGPGDAPNHYLAMNQVGADTIPERPVNVDGEVLFSPVAGRLVVRTEVITSLHDRDPYYLHPYAEPKELVDAIVLRFDTGAGLRFSTTWDDLFVELVDRCGEVKTASWGSVRAGFYNPADVNLDPVTGVESKSRKLFFGRKGACFAEANRVRFLPARNGVFRSVRGNACVRFEDAVFFALVDYGLHPTRKPGPRELSRREWDAFLAKVRALMEDSRFRPADRFPGVLDSVLKPHWDIDLLEDLEKWSGKALGREGRMRIEGLYGGDSGLDFSGTARSSKITIGIRLNP